MELLIINSSHKIRGMGIPLLLHQHLRLLLVQIIIYGGASLCEYDRHRLLFLFPPRGM